MRQTRRSILRAGLALAATASACPRLAWAAAESAYSDAAFARAQSEGKPIVVHIAASWCPTCAAQTPILESLARQPDFADVVRFRVDFDSQKPVVRRFRATMQSTLIVFHGETEAGRSVGQTDPVALRALFAKAVA